MKINIADEALKQLKAANIKDIRIIFHGQGCGGPVFSMVEGNPDFGEAVFKVQDLNIALKQDSINAFEAIDIDYGNSPRGGFTVEAENCGSCIHCGYCWLNTVQTDIIIRQK